MAADEIGRGLVPVAPLARLVICHDQQAWYRVSPAARAVIRVEHADELLHDCLIQCIDRKGRRRSEGSSWQEGLRATLQCCSLRPSRARRRWVAGAAGRVARELIPAASGATDTSARPYLLAVPPPCVDPRPSWTAGRTVRTFV